MVVITDGDLRRALKIMNQEWENLHGLHEHIVFKDPLVISSDKFAIEALELMEKNRKKPISHFQLLEKIMNLLES